MCFSPLLIGDRFEALSAVRRSSSSASFSPLLIGDRFEAAYPLRLGAAIKSFSPLLIGDRFEASPIHQAPSFDARVSVPSSSGIGLKLDKFREGTLHVGGFSPLLIGDRFEATVRDCRSATF